MATFLNSTNRKPLTASSPVGSVMEQETVKLRLSVLKMVESARRVSSMAVHGADYENGFKTLDQLAHGLAEQIARSPSQDNQQRLGPGR